MKRILFALPSILCLFFLSNMAQAEVSIGESEPFELDLTVSQEYEAWLEDLGDLAAVAERRREETTDHGKVIARFRADGLL